MNKNFNIIRPVGLSPRPNKYEERVAEICAKYFQSDIRFIMRGNKTTPDIQIVKTGECWEIKNIKGVGKHTIEDNLRKASKQSPKIIISLLATSKLDSQRVAGKIRSVMATRRMPIDSMLLITKSEKVIDIK